MRRSRKANSLVLTSNHNTDNPYDDTRGEQRIMHYTGMGKTGRVALAGEPYYEQQRGDDGQPRQVVKFMLRVV